MSHNGSKCGGVFHLETHLTGENPIRNLDSYLANHFEVPAVAIRTYQCSFNASQGTVDIREEKNESNAWRRPHAIDECLYIASKDLETALMSATTCYPMSTRT